MPNRRRRRYIPNYAALKAKAPRIVSQKNPDDVLAILEEDEKLEQQLSSRGRWTPRVGVLAISLGCTGAMLGFVFGKNMGVIMALGGGVAGFMVGALAAGRMTLAAPARTFEKPELSLVETPEPEKPKEKQKPVASAPPSPPPSPSPPAQAQPAPEPLATPTPAPEAAPAPATEEAATPAANAVPPAVGRIIAASMGDTLALQTSFTLKNGKQYTAQVSGMRKNEGGKERFIPASVIFINPANNNQAIVPAAEIEKFSTIIASIKKAAPVSLALEMDRAGSVADEALQSLISTAELCHDLKHKAASDTVESLEAILTKVHINPAHFGILGSVSPANPSASLALNTTITELKKNDTEVPLTGRQVTNTGVLLTDDLKDIRLRTGWLAIVFHDPIQKQSRMGYARFEGDSSHVLSRNEKKPVIGMVPKKMLFTAQLGGEVKTFDTPPLLQSSLLTIDLPALEVKRVEGVSSYYITNATLSTLDNQWRLQTLAHGALPEENPFSAVITDGLRHYGQAMEEITLLAQKQNKQSNELVFHLSENQKEWVSPVLEISIKRRNQNEPETAHIRLHGDGEPDAATEKMDLALTHVAVIGSDGNQQGLYPLQGAVHLPLSLAKGGASTQPLTDEIILKTLSDPLKASLPPLLAVSVTQLQWPDHT